MRPLGFIDSPWEAALITFLVVLFAVIGFAYVCGWLKDD